MIISMIVAMGKNRVIGKDNKLLWRLSGDLKKFKENTMGHHLLMGRKTFDSIGKPLPGRTSLVLTRSDSFTQPGCEVVRSINEAIELAEENGEQELFIIGGGQVYQDTITSVQRLYLTEVDCCLEGDTYFPEIDLSQWSTLVEEAYSSDQKNQYNWSYKVLERK